MKTFMKTRLLHLATFIIASATFLFAPPTAYAVPSFARQTGMACSACHTVFPELNSFGREFKLNGYTFTGMQQIQQLGDETGGGLKISETPPLSAMLVIGGTHLNKTPPDTQNNDIQFPQELSFLAKSRPTSDRFYRLPTVSPMIISAGITLIFVTPIAPTSATRTRSMG